MEYVIFCLVFYWLIFYIICESIEKEQLKRIDFYLLIVVGSIVIGALFSKYYTLDLGFIIAASFIVTTLTTKLFLPFAIIVFTHYLIAIIYLQHNIFSLVRAVVIPFITYAFYSVFNNQKRFL